MLELEKVFLEVKPDLVVVVGDVNSTLAGALAAVKSGIMVAHVEAGLRSRDRSMPEEINRLLTDSISHLLFTPSKDADENLRQEGVDEDRICLVGNIMIDALVLQQEAVAGSGILKDMELDKGNYIYLTLHRPSNVDDELTLEGIHRALAEVSGSNLNMVFPLHPRTRDNMERFGLLEAFSSIEGMTLCEPVGYVDSIALARSAAVVLTDSGGLQEETCFLGVPCLTLRPNTERPVTIAAGTNVLLDSGPGQIPGAVRNALAAGIRDFKVPPLWDGNTASRIVEVLNSRLS